MGRWLLIIFGFFGSYIIFPQGNLTWPDLSCSTDNISSGNDLCEGFVTNSNATIAIQTSVFENITLVHYNQVLKSKLATWDISLHVPSCHLFLYIMYSP